MASVTFAIKPELKREMSKFVWVNWSALARDELAKRQEINKMLLDRLNSKEEQELIKWSVELGRRAKKERFKKLLSDEDKFGKKLDMEPLRVLSSISLDKNIREVDGSLQIAKIYKSNRTEFFGIYWESSKGKPCFQGREYNEINKPLVRYFDPDTFEILESDLPSKLNNISEEDYQNDYEFIKDCYDETGNLKETVSEKEKHTLRLIFKDVAYRQFVKKQEDEQTAQIEEL